MIYTPDIVWLLLVAAMEKYYYRCRIEDGLCPNCGKTTYDWKVGSKRKKFCSERCRQEYKYRRPHPISEKTTQVRICPVCQNHFLTHREKSLAHDFCSARCREAYKYRIVKNNEDEQEGLEESKTENPISQEQEINQRD